MRAKPKYDDSDIGQLDVSLADNSVQKEMLDFFAERFNRVIDVSPVENGLYIWLGMAASPYDLEDLFTREFPDADETDVGSVVDIIADTGQEWLEKARYMEWK
jgi:hypothetical protein